MSLARILGKSKGRQSFVSDSRWVLPTTFIGLEHEYEGVKDQALPNHTFADFWTYHEEGSLKDHGAEYVFATPLFGVDANNALEWLVSYAKDSGWKCTKRTGIHVHLDVRDLTVPQLAGLCIIYAAVEPILYRWVGDGRDTSHFCIPLYKADEALLGACTIIRSAFQDDKDDGHSTKIHAEEFQRYAGFNLQALHKFGSIEFRQLQTTHDLVRIQDWVNMIMSLKATALKLPQSDGAVVRMVQRMGAKELLSYVFPPNLADKLYTESSEEDLRVRGLPSARDIAVHGCAGNIWSKREFPKGENKGFLAWIKSKEAKNIVKEEWPSTEVLQDNFDHDDNPEAELDPERPRGAGQTVGVGRMDELNRIYARARIRPMNFEAQVMPRGLQVDPPQVQVQPQADPPRPQGVGWAADAFGGRVDVAEFQQIFPIPRPQVPYVPPPPPAAVDPVVDPMRAITQRLAQERMQAELDRIARRRRAVPRPR